ncbi:hypothetical protein CBEVV_004 [Choristoneura biennis entomopoxvirus 'L' virophage]|nr:hypothetical protein CBEVV_004 [Choristoneura biennis entomopoxvirus 'L' virophage]
MTIKTHTLFIRSSKPSFEINKDIDGKIISIAVNEFGFDNNIFNIREDFDIIFLNKKDKTPELDALLSDNDINKILNTISGDVKACEERHGISPKCINIFNSRNIGKKIIKLTIAKGYYREEDIINIFKSLKDKNNKLDGKIELEFNKYCLKFTLINESNYYIFIDDILRKYLEMPNIIFKPNTATESVREFTNLNSRNVVIRGNNVKRGSEIILADDDPLSKNNNNKIILCHYIESSFSELDHVKVTEPTFYDYVYRGKNNLEMTFNITDEYNNDLFLLHNSNFFLKLLIKYEY